MVLRYIVPKLFLYLNSKGTKVVKLDYSTYMNNYLKLKCHFSGINFKLRPRLFWLEARFPGYKQFAN